MRSFVSSLALVAVTAGAVSAEDLPSAFVEANILGIFYHELGHALIDIEAVPIFGQEEDAADVFSILMIHSLFEEDAAQALAYEAASGFLGEAEMRQEESDDIAWWDVHGPDEQRFYNTVCIFYGGNPEERQDFAADLDLPEDRAEICPFEFEQADAAWGAVLDELVDRGAGDSIRFVGDADSLAAEILAEEVKALNAEMRLSSDLNVQVESCGEANAFYDPAAREVIFCAEFEDHLIEMENRL